MRPFFPLLSLSLAVGCAARPPESTTLFRDQFEGLRPGAFSHVLGPKTEYHYLPEVAPRNGWTVSNHLWGPSQLGWRVVEHEGQRALSQTFDNPDSYWHPMVVAGDPLWSSYRLEAKLLVNTPKRAGIALHYVSDRVYVFVGTEQGSFVIKTVEHEAAFHQAREKVWAQVPRSDWLGVLSLNVVVSGSRITASLGKEVLVANVEGFEQGRIALVASGATTFLGVNVVTDREGAAKLRRRQEQRSASERELARANPGMQLWRRFATPNFGVGRNLRFGDLDGDGDKDILIGQVKHHGPSDSQAELSCLTAVTVDGDQLWRIGDADPYHHHLTNDVALQIGDLDGDGRNEVIYTMNRQLVVADGATGETLRKTGTPTAPAGSGTDRPAPILGDALLLADLRGLGRRADLVIKDRYQHLWVYDDQLRPVWEAACNTGHYPFASDVNGDGKQELMAGYCLFSPDGVKLWSWESDLHDHADGVALVPLLGSKSPPKVVMVASDEGFILGNLDGRRERHDRIGHAQSASIANYRDDLPGLEVVVSDFWANQGIILVFDAHGNRIHEFEPMQAGSPVIPINWSGASEELFVLSADVEEGGLFDGRGRRAVRFPADGHPDLTFAVVDLTGDERDEIVVWNPHEIWIYTQDRAAEGPVSKRVRNSEFNESNYQIVVSTPLPND